MFCTVWVLLQKKTSALLSMARSLLSFGFRIICLSIAPRHSSEYRHLIIWCCAHTDHEWGWKLVGNYAPRENRVMAQESPPTKFGMWIAVSSCMGHCIQYWSGWIFAVLLHCSSYSHYCRGMVSLHESLKKPNSQKLLPVYTWQGWWCVYEGSPVLRGWFNCPGDCSLYRHRHRRWTQCFLVSWHDPEPWGIEHNHYLLGGLVLLLGKVPITACILWSLSALKCW